MALSPTLLADLRTFPQDPARFRMLAARLRAEGDVRGELIALQARRAESPEPASLAEAEERFLVEHARALLGPLWTSRASCSLAWELGFIRHALVWSQQLVARPPPRAGELARRTRELLALESSALLESLTLGLSPSPSQSSLFLDAVDEVAQAAPPTLKLLQLRDLIHGAPGLDAWHLPDYEPSRLRELSWRGRPFTVSADTLPLGEVAEALRARESSGP